VSARDGVETVEVCLAARPENVALARLALAGVAAMSEATVEEVADLKLAVSELCTNAVVHAYEDGDGYVLLRFTTAGDTLTVEVADAGTGFVELVDASSAARAEGGGLGLVIARAIADELSVESGKDGSRIVLSKRLGRAAG
jgi:anti-sigma regulatory factor (Ser/Thr protein kinase)